MEKSVDEQWSDMLALDDEVEKRRDSESPLVCWVSTVGHYGNFAESIATEITSALAARTTPIIRQHRVEIVRSIAVRAKKLADTLELLARCYEKVDEHSQGKSKSEPRCESTLLRLA